MASKSPFQSDLEQQLTTQPSPPLKSLDILRSGDIKPNSSTCTSSRASFEASIDALVNEQLVKLAEAARDPEAADQGKAALPGLGSVSSDEGARKAPLPGLTSGLEWNDSMEAGPILIETRHEEDEGKDAHLPYCIKPKFHIAAQSTLGRLSEDIARSSALSESLSASVTNGECNNSSNLGFEDSKSPVQSGHSSATTPATAGSTYESPFESSKFQDDAIARPPTLPEEAQQGSTSEQSSLVESLLTQAAAEAGSGSPSKAVPIIQEVMEMLKGNGEPTTHAQRSVNRLDTVDVARLDEDNPQMYRRQTGLKSLSVLETEGIPVRKKMGQGVLQELSNAPILRPNLVQEGGVKAAVANMRPTPARSAAPGVSMQGGGLPIRSQTLPSKDLLVALDELHQAPGRPGKDEAERPSTLQTIESGKQFIPSNDWPTEGDEDMSAPTALQQDISGFQPVEDTARSPPRSPSLFDLTGPQMSHESAEWLIAWEEIELGRRIGAGSYGEVFRAQWRHTDVAVKKITNVDESHSGEFKGEVNLMAKLKHPNVVQFLGACIEYPNLAIITQFMPRGSLFNLLHRAMVKLDIRQKLWMALDVAKGMHYLHSCRPPIVHGDVNSKNMLVDRDFSIRVADFGMSRQRRKAMLSAKDQGGTAEWTAPEVLRGLPYHEKADVYSFGVVLHELMTQSVPWSDLSSIQVVGAVGWGNARLQIPTTLPQPIRGLMGACMESDPQKRPDFEQIIVALRTIRSGMPAYSQGPRQERSGVPSGERNTVSPTGSQEVKDTQAMRVAGLLSRHSL